MATAKKKPTKPKTPPVSKKTKPAVKSAAPARKITRSAAKPPFLVPQEVKAKPRKKAVKHAKPKRAAPKPRLSIARRLKTTFSPLKLWSRARELLVLRVRLLTLTGGTAIVVVWTVLRHITNGVNFDIVGQIGLAQQWSQGLASGAQLGTTSYLLKMPFYLLINHLSFLSPMNRILSLALIFNLATFILLFILFEKLLKLYGVVRRSWLYLALAWLATIAGGVYWVDYANSRNLETVGGVLVIYLTLKYLKLGRLSTLIALTIAASIVFFADPLQLYVCGVGIWLFVLGRLLLRRTRANIIVSCNIIGALLVGYVASKLLFGLATTILPVTFLDAPLAHPALTVSNLLATLRSVASNTLSAFNADFLKRPYGINSSREFLNAVVLAGLLGLVFRAVRKVAKPVVFGLMLVIIIVNYLIYVASGQALQWETSRYLVMVPLLVIGLLAIRSDELNGKRKLKLQYGWALIIVVSSVLLLGGLVHDWPDRHSKDTRIGTVMSFMRQNDFKYSLSSREIGVTTTYFEQGKATILPMACQPNHTLHPTNLFYDNAAFKGLYYAQEVPIILQADGISFGANVCSQRDVVRQFGQPKRELNIPGVGMALVYNAASLHISDIDRIIGHISPYPPPQITKIMSAVAPPSTLKKLSGCSQGTIDVMVAHPDDDILFMNPRLSKQFGKSCIRTVFVTAGDAGHSTGYWMDRERGMETAYASMAGVDNVWADDVAVMNGHPVASRKLVNDPSVSLLFLNLPDGNVDGRGFPATGHTSLEKLVSNQIVIIQPVDGYPEYSYASLIELLSTVINTDKPRALYTQEPDSGNAFSNGDHSDHQAVGLLAIRANLAATSKAQVSTFVGYPDNGLPPNLTPDEITQKSNFFYLYAHEDGNICGSNGCSIDSTYGKYFSRSYLVDQNQNLVSAD